MLTELGDAEVETGPGGMIKAMTEVDVFGVHLRGSQCLRNRVMPMFPLPTTSPISPSSFDSNFTSHVTTFHFFLYFCLCWPMPFLMMSMQNVKWVYRGNEAATQHALCMNLVADAHAQLLEDLERRHGHSATVVRLHYLCSDVGTER